MAMDPFALQQKTLSQIKNNLAIKWLFIHLARCQDKQTLIRI
jgi:hypothetical protein